MAANQVTLCFKIHYVTSYGENVSISGTGPLGEWKTNYPMSYSKGEWYCIITVPAQTQDLEYKYFVSTKDGDKWEGGSNRLVYKEDLQANQFLEIRDQWRSTASPESTYLDSSLFREVVFGRTNPSAVQAAKATDDSSTVRFEITRTAMNDGDKIYVSGSADIIGNWAPAKGLQLSDAHYPNWSVEVAIPHSQFPFEYKYVIVRADNTLLWEGGSNRTSSIDHSGAPVGVASRKTVFADGDFRGASGWRGAGVAVPVFSLRTKDGLGVGEFLDLKLMVDWAAKCKLNLLQILPINDTTVFKDYRDSYPYSAVSVYALHPLYMRIDAITKDAAILKEVAAKREELNKLPQVDYEEVMRVKTSLLHRIFEQDASTLAKNAEFHAFVEKNKEWLHPYALFCHFLEKTGTSDWSKWGDNANITQEKIDKLSAPSAPHHKELLYSYWVQYHLHTQLLEAATYAKKNRVGLKGDLPIGVNRNSVDTWVYPHLFKMDKSTGAPPDAFSDDGQNWGFPTYNWDVMAKDNYRWWRNRLGIMAQYFHSFRIDHILGFFRIWEIPAVCVTGLAGRFNPALALHKSELAQHGMWDVNRLAEPYIKWHILEKLFGDKASYAANKFLTRADESDNFTLKEEWNAEKKIRANLSNEDKWMESGLFRLTQNVVLLREEGSDDKFHPRIEMQKTSSFAELDGSFKSALHQLYLAYFYQRQEDLWAQIGGQRLPVIKSCTKMLVCGEDLGMVPKCVPPVLNHLGILGLRIQRMPSDPKIEFYHPDSYEYLTVCSTSSHDMSTLRGWWEEDRVRSQRFYHTILGMHGQAPYFCEAYVSRAVLNQQLHSSSMLAVFPIQDWMGLNADLSAISPHDQKINEPANPLHYWRFRMHVSLEDLLKNDNFNSEVKGLVLDSGRNKI